MPKHYTQQQLDDIDRRLNEAIKLAETNLARAQQNLTDAKNAYRDHYIAIVNGGIQTIDQNFSVGDTVEAIEDRAPGGSPVGTPPIINKGDRFTVEAVNEYGNINFGTDQFWYRGSFKRIDAS